MLFEEQKNESGSMVLTMENHSLKPVVLEEGLEIGSLEPVQLVQVDSFDLTAAHTKELETSNNEGDSYARKGKLLDMLDVEDSLTKVESNMTELGHTDAV